MFVLTSCQPRIKNDIKTVDGIFKMSSFEIEIIHLGCFHYSKELLDISKTETTYLIKSRRTGKSNMLPQVKIDSLKEHLYTRIGKENYGGCTSGQYVRVGTFFSSVEYEHNYCTGLEAKMLNNLLNYYELINDEIKIE